ncbi:hypothetical protein PF002_g31901 [Phytophthora fragariae]|uniref:Uncharacterized protein n=1 Tax=Phytophthora fragariae TaxID=53985 RepID=A0A6A3PDW1_9STRA|nr:hypothetical protein PF011_g29434 [Phytophthora fragariae]KAE9058391.1 hypothetical protein PF007_g31320 [Phytophthora fragariae]KAE9066755.1 hypothetical protein PF006_g30149 [Phytophthora fragariae]KAE9163268.1 hypothetical protein PF002_g31901 [Phytophthora fragariae]KAE9267209.1 hypothetical protein PF001_g30179 [Phytophthora fragariae]
MVKILPGPYNLTRPLLAAALNVALEEGYTNIAAVMIRKSHLHSVECALGWAASRGYTDIVVMILDIYALRRYQFAPALKKVALNDGERRDHKISSWAFSSGGSSLLRYREIHATDIWFPTIAVEWGK